MDGQLGARGPSVGGPPPSGWVGAALERVRGGSECGGGPHPPGPAPVSRQWVSVPGKARGGNNQLGQGNSGLVWEAAAYPPPAATGLGLNPAAVAPPAPGPPWPCRPPLQTVPVGAVGDGWGVAPAGAGLGEGGGIATKRPPLAALQLSPDLAAAAPPSHCCAAETSGEADGRLTLPSLPPLAPLASSIGTFPVVPTWDPAAVPATASPQAALATAQTACTTTTLATAQAATSADLPSQQQPESWYTARPGAPDSTSAPPALWQPGCMPPPGPHWGANLGQGPSATASGWPSSIQTTIGTTTLTASGHQGKAPRGPPPTQPWAPAPGFAGGPTHGGYQWHGQVSSKGLGGMLWWVGHTRCCHNVIAPTPKKMQVLVVLLKWALGFSPHSLSEALCEPVSSWVTPCRLWFCGLVLTRVLAGAQAPRTKAPGMAASPTWDPPPPPPLTTSATAVAGAPGPSLAHPPACGPGPLGITWVPTPTWATQRPVGAPWGQPAGTTVPGPTLKLRLRLRPRARPCHPHT